MVAGMAPKTVLFFGATGLIGGSFLSQLYAKYGSATAEHYKITLASRSLEKANKIKDLLPGLEVVSLSLGDTEGIEREVEKYEVVIQLADCDAFQATLAILKGMKKRKEKTGQVPVLYHASGGAFIFEEVEGLPPSVPVSDTESARINAIPTTKPHRNVDDAIVQADEAGSIISYIIVPVGVYGQATGLIHERGLANPTSMPGPILINVSVDRGAVGQIGPGENVLGIVHVDDVANLFLLILESGTSFSHGKDGFYFAEHGVAKQKDVTSAVAKTLHELGFSKRDTPNEYTSEEVNRYTIQFWGYNLFTRGDKSRAIGWVPKHEQEEFIDDVVRETKRLAPLPFDSYGHVMDYIS